MRNSVFWLAFGAVIFIGSLIAGLLGDTRVSDKYYLVGVIIVMSATILRAIERIGVADN